MHGKLSTEGRMRHRAVDEAQSIKFACGSSEGICRQGALRSSWVGFLMNFVKYLVRPRAL